MHLLIFRQRVSSILKAESMAGIRLEQRLTTSRPMVTTQQLETEDNLPINKGTGGLEDTRTDPPNYPPLVKRKETDPKEL